jgi:CBS domain-containing protein
MLVSDAMNRFPAAIDADATVEEAAACARVAAAAHLLVLDEDHLVGILCACDLRSASAGEHVCDCMSVPVVTVRPDATIEDAAELMAGCGVSCLPVALGGLLLGAVGEEELRRAGMDPPLHRPAHHALH